MYRVTVGDFRIGPDERKAVSEVLDSGRISEGKFVREFERKWAEFLGTKYSLALNSGTSALIVGLNALKHLHTIPDKSKVITTPITYVATSNAVIQSGLSPVYGDVNPQTFCLEPEEIKKIFESADNLEEYSLILPVHLMGFACDMDKINHLARKFGVRVFEDSAQAHGTVYKKKKTGSLGELSAFSFYIAHNIQAGELGAIATDNMEIFRLAKKLKANGRMCDCLICTRHSTGCLKMKSFKGEADFDPRFTHDLVGFNFKAMEFQAALALVQLEKADWILKKRQENVKYLNDHLEVFSDSLQLPKFSSKVSYLAYPLVIKDSEKISRKKLRVGLESNGVETRPLFGCIPTQQPAFAHLKYEYSGRLPQAEHLGENAFYVGCHQYLEEKDLEQLVKAFRQCLA